MPAHLRRALRVGLVACGLAVLGGAGTAGATTVAVDDEGTLRIRDSGADPNALEVRPSGDGYEVLDYLSRLTTPGAPFAGCQAVPRSRHKVVCEGKIVKVSVDAGAGGDVVYLRGVEVPVEATGGPGDDLLEGGTAKDQLAGGPGNDAVNGDSGDDMLAGDDGDDLLKGGTGGDMLDGGSDADILEGEAGNFDTLIGGTGPDLLKGGAGNDALQGGPGSDVLVTGAGTDTASTGSGSDQVFGTTGDKVNCEFGDLVQTGSTPPPIGCPMLPSAAKVPDIWPPPPADGGSSNSPENGTVARAALAPRKPTGTYNVRVLQPNRANSLTVLIKEKSSRKLQVRVRPIGPKGRRLRPFLAILDSKFRSPIPAGVTGVQRATAGCCPR